MSGEIESPCGDGRVGDHHSPHISNYDLKIITRLKNNFKELEKKYYDSKKIIEQLDKLNLINESESFPIFIFYNAELSSLELIVKYMFEVLNLSKSKISVILNRNSSTIWNTYNNSLEKSRKKFSQKKLNDKKIKNDNLPTLRIPFYIFKNRKLSVLENIVLYLIKKNISITQISKILNKNQQTIYTIRNRIIKKEVSLNE
jgi:DNA-binding CsgD family transcriptional regulator